MREIVRLPFGRDDSERDAGAARMGELLRPPAEEDWALRVRRGEPAVFEEMYAEYGGRLCAYAYRWTDSRAIAEELVQDVFLNIWTHRRDWEVGGSLTAYLFRSVRNLMLNYLRHQRVERRYEGVVDNEWVDTHQAAQHALRADESLTREERRIAIQRAIAGLPERSHEIFLLNREQGLTYSEIASMLGISTKTVEYHMGRAFAQLRRSLAAWSPDVADPARDRA